MKSIIKFIGLLSLLTLLILIESSTSKRNKKSHIAPQQVNYVTSPAKVKYDYTKIDTPYKNESLKQNPVHVREKALYEYTVRKVFKLFEVQDSAVDVCVKTLNSPALMHLMLKTFSDRSKDNSVDEFYMKHVKLYPPSCLEPLHKMKDELAKKINQLKDAVYQFKKVQRRLRRLRQQREQEKSKPKTNKKKNKNKKQKGNQ